MRVIPDGMCVGNVHICFLGSKISSANIASEINPVCRRSYLNKSLKNMSYSVNIQTEGSAICTIPTMEISTVIKRDLFL